MPKLPFVGEPKPADQIEREGRPRYDWVEIFKAVKHGSAQQVDVKFDTVQAAITRLELEGEIVKGEYRVRSIGSRKGGRRVYIIRD